LGVLPILRTPNFRDGVVTDPDFLGNGAVGLVWFGGDRLLDLRLNHLGRSPRADLATDPGHCMMAESQFFGDRDQSAPAATRGSFSRLHSSAPMSDAGVSD